ncbi:MAG: RNA polymerase sigma factor (sigma-70 family) [Verrucomicrobiales bacterium]|jgi:RNA polymerase sigma factor (sigma-70 family)
MLKRIGRNAVARSPCGHTRNVKSPRFGFPSECSGLISGSRCKFLSECVSAVTLLNDDSGTMDEIKQLKSYVEDDDQQAFKAIVDDYVGLVFGIALRRTGNRQDAEDITQKVFEILPRKATNGLKIKRSLSSWLYQTTLLQSSSIMRSNRSRKRRMEECAMRYSIDEGGRSVWSEVFPYLDEAMGKLTASDRDLLLLRFFAGKSFGEISLELGKTASACQRQAHRALEKLAQLLQRKNVKISATFLGTGLAGHLAAEAPAGLAALVNQAGIREGAGSTSSALASLASFVAVHNARTAMAITLGGGIPLIFGWWHAQSLQAQVHSVDNKKAVAPAMVSSAPAGNHPAVVDGSADAATLLFEIKRGLMAGDRAWEFKFRNYEFDRRTATELKSLLAKLDGLPGEGYPKTGFETFATYALAKKDPEFTLNHVLNAEVQRFYSASTTKMAMESWARSDATAATDWLTEKIGKSSSEKLALRDDMREALLLGLIQATVSQDLKTAITLAEQLKGSNAGSAVDAIARVALKDHSAEEFFQMIARIPVSEGKIAEIETKIRRGREF